MIQMLLRKIIAGTAIVCCPVALMGQAIDPATPLPFDTAVYRGQLPNGLKYYIRPNGRPAQKVELRLVVNAGSILEQDDQQGLAHFMEHMNFNGTRHYPKNALVDFLQSIGVQFGADLNAYTGFDETVYILPVPTDKPGNVAKGFEVLADWAQGALLTDKDINEERKVVLEESRLGKGADDRMMKVYLPELLAGSRYASRLPIGKEDILKTAAPERIRAYYRDWYRPDLMAVAVVGDITVPEARKLIEKYFSSLKNPVSAPQRREFDMPAFSSTHAMVLSDKEATNTQFQLVYPSRRETVQRTVGDYRKQLMRRLFTLMLNSRLQELTQSATPPFITSYGYISGWARHYENFQLVAMSSGDVKTAINAAVGELVRAQQFGFNPSELSIAKKRLEASAEKAYNERTTTESEAIIDEYVQHFLSAEPVPGIVAEYSYYKELLPGISIAEVNTEAKAWLSDNKQFFALSTGPDNARLQKMDDAQLLSLVRNALQQQMTPKAEKVPATSLLAQQPLPGRITATEQDTGLGSTTYTLSNGVKVTVKSTDFKSDEIIISGVKKGGQGNYGPEDRSSFTFSNMVVEAMGYGQFTPTDLKDFLSGKVVQVRTNMRESADFVSGSASVKDLETLFQLLYLKLTQPRDDTALFKGYQATMTSWLEFMTANPQVAFNDTLNKVFYHNDPRAAVSMPSREDINRISRERVLAIYRDEYSNADGFHFFLAGNIDQQQLLPLLEQYVAALPVKGTTPTFKDNGLRPVSGVNNFDFRRGTEPKSMISALYYGEIPYSEALELQAGLLSDLLNIKIIEELREKIGGIYSGRIAASLTRYPYSHYSVSLSLPCGPESVDTLIKASEQEIAAMIRNGPSAKDLAKVKLARIETYRENMKKNGFWTGSMMNVLFWGSDKDRFLQFESYLDKITAADIQLTAKRLFNSANRIRAVLYPEQVQAAAGQ